MRDAIISISTFFHEHALQQTQSNSFADACYQRVIRGLRQRQNLLVQNKLERRCVVVALLILWATIAVNGFSDFRVVHRLLEEAWSACNDGHPSNGDELDTFIAMQIAK